MVKSCCAIDCTNRFDKRSELSFYRLPKAKEKRSKWIAAICRNNWNPGNETWICGCHFVSGKKSDDPLHPDYIPSLFNFTSTVDRIRAVNNLERYERSQEEFERSLVNGASTELAATALLDLRQSPAPGIKVEVIEVQSTEVQTEETHDDIALLHEQIRSLNTVCLSLQDKVDKLETELKHRSLDPSQFDDSKMKFFTGLPSLQTFMLLFSYVSSVLPATPKQSLKPKQEQLLTLMKLHLNLSEEFLGYLFGIHQSTVSRIFHRWMNVMASRLHPLILWPEREDLRRSSPVCFQSFFKSCVSIIDFFEVFIERPSDLEARAQTWSNFKQHNTIKFLISFTPQGNVSFVSKAWGGRVADQHLINHSGILEKLQPGDLILAERSFSAEDSAGLFCAKVVTLTGGEKQLSRTDTESVPEMSDVRFHVERMVGALRQRYKILRSTLQVSVNKVEQIGGVEESLVDKIVLTCGALCNLCQTVVPSE